MDTLFGLPAHPLIVHGVVVLVPLAGLGALACVLSQSLRNRIGWIVVGFAVLDVVLVPLATSSGEALEKGEDETAALEKHTEMAEGLLPFVIALAVGVLALMLLDHYRGRAEAVGASSGSTLLSAPWVVVLVAAVTVLGAVGSLVQAVRIGHSGASATWGDE